MKEQKEESKKEKNPISYFNWVLQKKCYPECISKNQLILSFISLVCSYKLIP